MNETQQKLLVVDDEAIALNNLTHILKKEGYAVTATQNGPEALEYIEQEEFNLVLTDLKMEKVDGMRLLSRVKELYPDTEVVMITGFATIDSAIEAMRAGAYHYIAKPYKLDEVRKVVKEALEKNQLKKENLRLKEHLQDFHGEAKLITDNPRMKRILEMALQAASTDTNVAVSGEPGTGKELLANFIHARSSRNKGPFLSLHCGAFTEELLAEEFLGLEKDASEEIKKGLVEKADGGTLFLDEINKMPAAMQVKLLNAIHDHEILRVGATTPIKVNVRFIAGTNQGLQKEVAAGRFRQDLFFEMNVISLDLPPLSERKSDVPLLLHHFIKKYTMLMNKNIKEVSPDVVDILMQHDFPGNIRELEKIVERGVALTNGETIEPIHLPENLRGMGALNFRKRSGRYQTLRELEASYIEWILKESGGNKTDAAHALDIDRAVLLAKMKELGLE